MIGKIYRYIFEKLNFFFKLFKFFSFYIDNIETNNRKLYC